MTDGIIIIDASTAIKAILADLLSDIAGRSCKPLVKSSLRC
jgi:hypothetical protein